MTSFHNRRTAGFALGVLLALSFFAPLGARQAAGVGPCRITGHAASGTTPLPGVSIAVKTGDTPHAATSTEVDGGFAINLRPGQYTLSAELTGFARVERPLVVVADGACNQTVNLTLALMPRQPLASTPRAATASAPQPAGQRGQSNAVQVQPAATASQGTVVDATGAAGTATAPEREAEEAGIRLLLPPGFSSDAPADAITISGNAASVDRGMMNDRFDAIGRDEKSVAQRAASAHNKAVPHHPLFGRTL